MPAMNEIVAALVQYQISGFAALMSQRDKLVTQLGGIYATLFAARTLLPLRLTTAVYDGKPVTAAQLGELLSKASLGITEGDATDRSHRRHIERIASLHNAWVGRHGGFARANSKDGVAVIESLLKAKPKAFKDEAAAWLKAFSLLSVTMPEAYVINGVDVDGEFIRPVSSSDKLDVFLEKQGSKTKAAKRQSISVAKKGKAAKAAKVQAKAEAAVASAKADPAKVDEGVRTAGLSSGSTLPKAVVEANSTNVGQDVEARLPGSALGWSEFVGTAKQTIDALISDSTLSLEQKRQRLAVVGKMLLEANAAVKAVADTIKTAPKAASAPAEQPKAETVVVVTETKAGPVMSIKAAKPKRAAKAKPRDVAAKLATNGGLTVTVANSAKPSRAERKAANKAAFAASRAAMLAAKANGAATH